MLTLASGTIGSSFSLKAEGRQFDPAPDHPTELHKTTSHLRVLGVEVSGFP
jgi:hypothetical protein